MMNLPRALIVAGGVAVMLHGAALPVWAQASAPPAEALRTIDAVAYGLVGLGVVLGLANVLRPGKRKGEKPKPT